MPKTTPNYIKNLLMPQAKSPQGRKVWSIDLENIWIPFLTATNTMGDTAIPLDALGSPIRLAYDKDGSVRFGRTGRPITRVAKPISESVSLIRQNFVAHLVEFAESVATEKQAEYAKVVELANTAGQPIIAHDRAELDKAIQEQLEEAMRQAQAQKVAEPEPEREPALVS